MAVRVTNDSAYRGLSPSGRQARPSGLTLRQRVAKRALDVVASTILLLVLSPLMAVVAVLVLVVSKRPVLFRQGRVGWNGEVVPMLKFRTMVVGAQDLRGAVWRERSQLRTAPPSLFKLRDDPRVTGLGRVLRRWSIDELPQLWNVLRGDMSLVGPRPLMFVDHHQAAAGLPGMEDRLLVRPGITGAWQVRGRCDLGVEDMVALDLAYIDRWTFGRDIRLLAATVPAVLRGRGAY